MIFQFVQIFVWIYQKVLFSRAFSHCMWSISRYVFYFVDEYKRSWPVLGAQARWYMFLISHRVVCLSFALRLRVLTACRPRYSGNLLTYHRLRLGQGWIIPWCYDHAFSRSFKMMPLDGRLWIRPKLSLPTLFCCPCHVLRRCLADSLCSYTDTGRTLIENV